MRNILSITFLLLLTIGLSAQDSTQVKEEINPTMLSLPWFEKFNTIEVSSLNDESALEILDTINYDVLSQAQVDSLNIRIAKFKQRYIAKHGKFPVVYPSTKIWIPNMGCDKCAKDVKTMLLIETHIVKKVKSVDIQSDMVSFTYDTSFVSKEDSMVTILANKLKVLKYDVYSLDDATNPELMMKIAESTPTEGELKCPIHGHASQESLFPYGETEEERAGDPAWIYGDSTDYKDTIIQQIPITPEGDKK